MDHVIRTVRERPLAVPTRQASQNGAGIALLVLHVWPEGRKRKIELAGGLGDSCYDNDPQGEHIIVIVVRVRARQWAVI